MDWIIIALQGVTIAGMAYHIRQLKRYDREHSEQISRLSVKNTFEHKEQLDTLQKIREQVSKPKPNRHEIMRMPPLQTTVRESDYVGEQSHA